MYVPNFLSKLIIELNNTTYNQLIFLLPVVILDPVMCDVSL